MQKVPLSHLQSEGDLVELCEASIAAEDHQGRFHKQVCEDFEVSYLDNHAAKLNLYDYTTGHTYRIQQKQTDYLHPSSPCRSEMRSPNQYSLLSF
jgi:hypothetical protein